MCGYWNTVEKLPKGELPPKNKGGGEKEKKRKKKVLLGFQPVTDRCKRRHCTPWDGQIKRLGAGRFGTAFM